MYNYFGRGAEKVSRPARGPRDPSHPGWPESTSFVTLATGKRMRLRPLMSTDGPAWRELRLIDEAWLRPVEPTMSGTWESSHSILGWKGTFKNLRTLALQGTVVPMAIELEGDFVGQVTVGNIQHGSISEAWIGYWVASSFMGQGVATAACSLGTDHAFTRIGLHRLTATFLPHNPASGRVLELSGYREEGFLRKSLHIDGRWQDHHFVAQNVDDYPDSAVDRLIRAGRLLPEK
ncbi:GNAT family protein [Corynebacterium breve]|uniref:GNAT family protein n=1 Tax=Corynebacterium breve TaxID=3049799 RepID=A0ABY8VFJ4_9CORY|nr:GNAT family protein [Corynebacterium breve]WIM68426.1 GNAT family protein [Corynebacterium breve]